MKRKAKKAQSIVEYLLMLGALILVIIISTKTIASKSMRQAEVAEKSMNKAITTINTKL